MLLKGEHQDARLRLGLRRQRQVHGHLVAVEVRVERVADQRVDLDRLALDQHRLERLDAEAVEVGARFRTGCSWMTSSSTSQTSGIIESTIFLAP